MAVKEEKPTPDDEEMNETAPEEEPEEESAPQVKETEAEMTPEEEVQAAETYRPPPAQESISPSTEHNWAMIAHLSILLNLVTGVLGPVVALIIYLVYRDRSRYIAYQSLQSTIFQLIVWVGVGLVIGAIWLFTGVLSVFLIGLLLVPFALLATLFLLVVPFGSLIYGVYAGIKCSDGEDFRYWLVGDWVRGTYEEA
jgi:uncharacterized Tic20 family protein